MPINVRQINTAESLTAVKKIKSAVKKEGLGLSFDIPKEFAEKRKYMQSDEFIKDEHNAKMFDLFEKLGELREKIGEEIAERNKNAKDEIVQGINGFSRIKKYLDINNEMNFSKQQSFHTPLENEYNILRRYKIGNLARIAKNNLGLK